MRVFLARPKVLIWLLILNIVVSTEFRDQMGKIEGHFFPVIQPATLISYTSHPPPAFRARWKASAVKMRDCPGFSHIDWRLGFRSLFAVRVFAEFRDRPQVRARGVLTWDALDIWLTPEAVRVSSHAYVYHRCHPLWLTRSLYFDSERGPRNEL